MERIRNAYVLAAMAAAVAAGAAKSQPASPSADLPDLSVSDVRVESARVVAALHNSGTATPATRATTTLFVREHGQVAQRLDVATPAVSPGGSGEVVFAISLKPGQVYQVMVDSTRVITESDETNNRTLNATVPGPKVASRVPLNASLPRVPRAVTAPARPAPIALPRDGVTVDPALMREARKYQLGRDKNGNPRVAAVARFADGALVPFVESELLLSTKDEVQATALAARHNGQIARIIKHPEGMDLGSTYVIRVDTGTAPPSPFTPMEAGTALSSEAARNLLAIGMTEHLAGVEVGLNLVVEGHSVVTGKTLEGGGQDALSLDYMQTDGLYDVDVARAWKALFVAGKTPTPRPVLVGIIDGGFSSPRAGFSEKDLDIAFSNGGSPSPVLNSDGEPSPWHGTWVAEAAAGLPDDGRGVSGSGGLVARVALIDYAGASGSDDIYDHMEIARKLDVSALNMSFGGKVPTSVFDGLYTTTLEKLQNGTIYMSQFFPIFAAAGNHHENVDAKDEDGDETYWHWPCENRGVICVGGWYDKQVPPSLGDGMRGKIPAAESNYSTGGGEGVDIWGPWCVKVGDDPDNPGPEVSQQMCGTSLASPLVAGVAALIKAGNPNLTPAQIWDLMNKHAIQGGPLVRRVHAYRAVREAIMSAGQDIAPQASIKSPVANAKLSQGLSTLLSVDAFDIEDESTCCDVAWSLGGKAIAKGKATQFSFGGQPLGPQVITATITDKGGNKVVKEVTATLENKPPTLKVASAPQGTLTTGLTYNVVVEVIDDESAAALPMQSACAKVGVSDPLKGMTLVRNGCTFSPTFTKPGMRTLEFTYADAYDAPASAGLPLIVNVPLPGALSVGIVSPGNGNSFTADDTIVLQRQVVGAVGIAKETWTLTETGAPSSTRTFQPSHTSEQTSFRLRDVFPEFQESTQPRQYHLTLTVSTSSGQISKPATITVAQRGFIH